MERCTERSYGGYGVLKDGYTTQFALSKLAAYEDIGLTPEEIENHEEMFKAYRHVCGGKSPEEIATLQEQLDISRSEVQGLSRKLAKYQEAEEQGLLLRAMCKAGDLVYETNFLRNIVSTYRITSVIIMPGSINYRWKLIDGIYSNIDGFNEYALGKSVFLTREEAEKALEGDTSEIRGSHDLDKGNPLTASIINTMVEAGRKALKGNHSIDSE